ncbi:endonuclease/exonuclease/phosphatase family protein [Tissierella pigra]|uniref:Endonuclease/exonuclease/phosphatase domain-containing protein n=1 Tax=Tissierella pigra TaxID=2607614 RepID=A0A6N7Y292_9FIRM|nr:endonuclease/exonuclease/phosphatase family protein [Tissierella pigra]MSU02140.1 hypothetical protein [Tissierella pigra]
MNYLFWNTNRNDNNHILEELIIDGDCDFVGLAEYNNDSGELIELRKRLYDKGLIYYIVPDINDNRINILSRYEILPNYIFTDSKYFRIVSISNSKGEKILIAVVHFPSKLHIKESTMNSILRSFRMKLEDAEQILQFERLKELLDNIINMATDKDIKDKLKIYNKSDLNIGDIIIKIGDVLIKEKKLYQYFEINKAYVLNRYTLVMGDFNINPFEDSMVNADTLHALSSKNIAKKIRRIVYEESYDMFYNPMWNKLGDENGDGTYYYNSSQITNYYWNILDQFIVRPEIADIVNVNDIKIITQVGKYILKKDSGIPDKGISDHFPLYFKLGGV